MISHLNLLDAMGTMPARFVAELFDAEAFDPSALEAEAKPRSVLRIRFAAIGGLAACIALLLAAGLYLRGGVRREEGLNPQESEFAAVTEVTRGTEPTAAAVTTVTQTAQSRTEPAATTSETQTTAVTAEPAGTEPVSAVQPVSTEEASRTEPAATVTAASSVATETTVTEQSAPEEGFFDPTYPYLRIVFAADYTPDPADYAEYGTLVWFVGHWELELPAENPDADAFRSRAEAVIAELEARPEIISAKPELWYELN